MKHKRHISFILLIMMLVMSVPNVTPAFASELTLNGGYYEISSENDFYLIKDLSAKYKIVSDITITKEFEPFGSLQRPFTGKIIGALNGNGKEKPTITIASSSYNGLVDYLNGGEITNIILAGNIKTTNSVFGGFVNTAKDGKLTNLVNNADITVNYSGSDMVYVGGILGKTVSTNSLALSDCENNGNITQTTSAKGYVGGIAGNIVSFELGEFTSCTNNGNIVSSSENVGGIAGNVYTSSKTDFHINTGDVTNTSKTGYAGGIAGSAQTNIETSYNTGKITAENVAAGIVANLVTNYAFTVSNCYNTGEIHGTGAASGILGVASGTEAGTVATSYNIGDLYSAKAYEISPISNVVNRYDYYMADYSAHNKVLSPLTEEDMKIADNYSGFSTEIWTMNEDTEYPYIEFISKIKKLDEKGYLFLEAEDGVKNSGEVQIKFDENASGGKYIKFINSYTSITDYSTISAPHAQYSFELTEDTEVMIWFRIMLEQSNQDTMICGIDGTYERFNLDTQEGYYWKQFKRVTLSKGVHTLETHSREWSGYDRILITSIPTFFPAGLGGKPDDPVEEVHFYEAAAQKPLVEGHPRVALTKEDIPTIKENLLKPQNAEAYKKHLLNLESTSDGKLPAATGSGNNYDGALLEVIESRAFEYVLNGDSAMGRSAIEAMMNYLLTMTTNSSAYTEYYSSLGEIVYKTAIVYDWCHDLLTDEEKEQFYRLFLFLAPGFEQGWPPRTAYSMLSGHGSETQVMRDMLSIGIAMYDEYPYLYDNIAGLVLGEMIEFRKWIYQGHVHPEGPHYVSMRFAAEMASTMLWDKIGYPEIMGPDQQYVPYWMIYARRPDGLYLRNGDGAFDAYAPGYFINRSYEPFFYVANYYGDPYVKEEVMKMNNSLVSETPTNNRSLSAVEILIFNDPDLEGISSANLPLTKYFASPYGGMIARTGWNDGIKSDAVVAEMKVSEWWMHGHSHLDSGAFQIYYKGALATDSGYYQNNRGASGSNTDNTGNTYYGTKYYYNYASRTSAHNCMLVYNPDLANLPSINGYTLANDGGQKHTQMLGSGTFDLFKERYETQHKMGETLAHEFGLDPIEPNYTYLKGDLSFGYSDNVNGYERSFMFLNLKNDEVPAALLVFDRVDSKSASYKKTWRLHTVNEPQIDGTHTVAVKDDDEYNGKLTLDTLLPANPSITKIHGSVTEGVDYVTIPSEGGNNESAGWILEVSPSGANTEDYFLNVMQMSDADSEAPALEVTMIEAGSHVGAKIYDRVVMFGKAKDRVKTDVSFSFTGEGEYEITVTDLVKGTWMVLKDGSEYASAVVTEEGGVAVINGASGAYTLKFVSEEGEREEYIVEEKPLIDTVYIKNNLGYYQYTEAVVENGITMMPAEEIASLIYLDYTTDGNAVTFSGYGRSMTVNAGSYTASSSLGDIALTAVSEIRDGKLFIPLRPVAEFFYNTLGYNAYPGVITVSTTASKPEKGYATIVDCDWIANMATTDGYKSYDTSQSTGWATAAAAGSGDCEITYHFGSPQPISQIEILYSNPHQRTFTYDILVSNDKVNWTPVITNGQSLLGTEKYEWQTIDLGGTQNATYLKYVGKGNSGSNANNIVEIKFKN